MVTSSRWCAAAACAMGMTAGLHSSNAMAFDVKHTAKGQPLRWTDQVSYVIDPSLESSVPGGAGAASRAVAAWSATGGGPVLSAHLGEGSAKPGLDGQNTVVFARDGFAPAGKALAVTVTSYDEATGRIVDADIVINGLHDFSVLAADSQPASGASAVATDGSPAGAGTPRIAPFDLVHVLSHEVGHSLGLADEREDHAALMYAFTVPGDASIRTPSSDDIDGVDAIYGAYVTAPSSVSSASHGGGCGQASVAGGRTRAADGWGAFALLAGAGAWLGSRRRFRIVRVVLPIGAALAALVARPEPARSASLAPLLLADAAARVVQVTTTNVAGVFETTVELAPMACRQTANCPDRALARTWGGRLGGIVQRVGEEVVPTVGDVVDVTFRADDRPLTGTATASLLALRR